MDIRKTLLLEVDVQNDFCPGGELAVQDSDVVIAPLNALATAFAAVNGRVAATQDWHPPGHISFASSHAGKEPGDIFTLDDGSIQVLWPDHCVQGKGGAAFHNRLDLKPVDMIIRKGFHRMLDSYSTFFENDHRTSTGLDGWIRGLGIDTIIIGGLATDYCVLYSALDAVMLGFSIIVVEDAVRGVDCPEGSLEKAIARMKAAGVSFITSEDLLKELR